MPVLGKCLSNITKSPEPTLARIVPDARPPRAILTAVCGRRLMTSESETSDENHAFDRWMLIRDVAVFQVKLLFDGLRDVLLLPISLIAGVVSLVRGGAKPGPEFYDLLRIGRRSERWINLFGAAAHLHGPPTAEEKFAGDDVDKMVSRIEAFVVDEYRRGGVTAQAKDRLDSALDLLHKKARRRDGANS